MNNDQLLESLAQHEQESEQEFLARQFEILPEIEAYENARWLWRLWALEEGKGESKGKGK